MSGWMNEWIFLELVCVFVPLLVVQRSSLVLFKPKVFSLSLSFSDHWMKTKILVRPSNSASQLYLIGGTFALVVVVVVVVLLPLMIWKRRSLQQWLKSKKNKRLSSRLSDESKWDERASVRPSILSFLLVLMTFPWKSSLNRWSSSSFCSSFFSFDLLVQAEIVAKVREFDRRRSTIDSGRIPSLSLSTSRVDEKKRFVSLFR